jgi:GDPmannose 4,6-dehydratase
MVNIDLLRDWGHARDYVRMQWMMLQQEMADDYVIATGKQHSLREFIFWWAAEQGIALRFDWSVVEKTAVVVDISGDKEASVKDREILMRVN